jgi:hypothetical protein
VIKKAQSIHWSESGLPSLAYIESDWADIYSIVWNGLMKMANGLFGIQEEPFMGILMIKLPEEVALLRSNLIIARRVFQKNMLQHGFEHAVAWFYPTPRCCFWRYWSIGFDFL